MRWPAVSVPSVLMAILLPLLAASCRSQKTLVSSEVQLDSNLVLRRAASLFSLDFFDTCKFFEIENGDTTKIFVAARRARAVGKHEDSVSVAARSHHASGRIEQKSNQVQPPAIVDRSLVFVAIYFGLGGCFAFIVFCLRLGRK